MATPTVQITPRLPFYLHQDIERKVDKAKEIDPKISINRFMILAAQELNKKSVDDIVDLLNKG